MFDSISEVWGQFVLAHPERRDYLLIGCLIFLAVFGCLLFLFSLVDLLKHPQVFIHHYKIQRRDGFNQLIASPATLLPAVGYMLCGLVVILCGFFFLDILLQPLGFGITISPELPSLFETFYTLLASTLSIEVLFYYWHRALHENLFLYTTIHKIHHSQITPCALSALYAHPLEVLTLNFLCSVLPLFLLKSHVIFLFIGNAVGAASLICEHSGYNFTDKIFDIEGHDLHHLRFVGNYGVLVKRNSLISK